MTLQVINPASMSRPSGWNHGMLAPAGGRWLFVAGQTAHDAEGNVVGGNLVEQWDVALGNVLAVVREAGGEPTDVARMTVYVASRTEYVNNLKELGTVWRAQMGKHYPAMALVEVSAFVDPRALLEIEATAVITADNTD